MGKSKKPRKPNLPVTELEQRERVPLPERRSPLPQRSSPAASRPVLYELLQTIRTAVGAMLDIADAAAEAITRQLEGRA
jgi:hypothetical protein